MMVTPLPTSIPSILACSSMARPPMHGSVIVPDWHETVEGKEYLACILRKNRRREFGKSPTPTPLLHTTATCTLLTLRGVTSRTVGPAHRASPSRSPRCHVSTVSSLKPPSPNLLKTSSTNRARNMETARPCQQPLSPELLWTEPSSGVMPSAGHFAQWPSVQPCFRRDFTV